jgi:hypothetical protein
MTYGGLPVCDYYGDVNPACVLVWGHNPVVSGPDGEIQFRAKEARHLCGNLFSAFGGAGLGCFGLQLNPD